MVSVLDTLGTGRAKARTQCCNKSCAGCKVMSFLNRGVVCNNTLMVPLFLVLNPSSIQGDSAPGGNSRAVTVGGTTQKKILCLNETATDIGVRKENGVGKAAAFSESAVMRG